MKNGLLVQTAIAVFLYAGCSNHREAGKAEPHSQTSKQDLQFLSIVNGNGQELQMAYDTTAHTLHLAINSDTILLHQDTLASGIKYSNPVYEYREWHREITLDSSGKTIFSSKPSN